MTSFFRPTLLAAAVCVGATTSALAVTVSGTTMATVNDGVEIDGTRADDQSLFSNEFATSTDTADYLGTEYSTGSIALSDLPVVDGSFQFIFDSQETGGSPTISIDEIILVVGGTEIWNFDEVAFGSLDLDGTTNSPLGNGADMGLYVDVGLFAGLTGADTLDFYWTQSDANNGADEWVVVGDGFFDPNTPIGAVPVPASALLLGTAFVGSIALGRRRKAAKK